MKCTAPAGLFYSWFMACYPAKLSGSPILNPLSQHCRPVIVELLGHGRSPSPEDPAFYSPDNYALEFERIRNELAAEKWFICGQSLGAALTLRYALNYPDQIIAQIFTNSRSAFTHESMDETMNALARLLEEKGREIIDNFPLHPSKNKRLDSEIKSALIEDINLINVNGFSNTCLYTVAGSSIRHLALKNKVPTLLIAGKFDKGFMPLLDYVRANFPLLEWLVLDGGHAVNLDASEQFTEAVIRFMARFKTR